MSARARKSTIYLDMSRSLPSFEGTPPSLPEAFRPRHQATEVRAHLPWPARDTRPKRDALVTLAFASDACDALEESGELHVVADSEAVVEEACGTLTRSRLFAPCLAFPFHQAGVPAAYPRGDLLCADAALSTDGRSDRQLFYSRWEKRAASLPNFRFRGGRGRNEAAPDVPPPAKRAIEAPPPGKTKLSGGARSRG
ncbi:unnamed protein product [Prorocentrum cordatum]|uniref:Uncharacterized protein n=1 Tax=Prorocentrum cordatum TaxID=2364126 RepID=A0ABN9VAN7_9DINO|nr:unnamed protein product [Polarella glacialis]